MKNIAIVYQSTYGYAKTYAEWLSQSLTGSSCDAQLLDLSKTDLKKVLAADIIVYLGGIYADSVNGFAKLRAQSETLKTKDLLLCSVGLTPVDDVEIIQRVHQKALGNDLPSATAFHLPGGLDMNKLGFLHKNMLKLIFSQLKKQETLSPLEASILACQDQPQDFSCRDALAPVMKAISAAL